MQTNLHQIFQSQLQYFDPIEYILSFHLDQQGNYVTHGFTWTPKSVFFQSGHGHYEDYKYPILSWLFNPWDYQSRIPQKTMPLHINLYLWAGYPPTDNKEVEIIIKKFCFKSLDNKQNNCAS